MIFHYDARFTEVTSSCLVQTSFFYSMYANIKRKKVYVVLLCLKASLKETLSLDFGTVGIECV